MLDSHIRLSAFLLSRLQIRLQTTSEALMTSAPELFPSCPRQGQTSLTEGRTIFGINLIDILLMNYLPLIQQLDAKSLLSSEYSP